jgi:predicted acylesterase/phospholipase RssA
MLALAKALMKKKDFTSARRILGRALLDSASIDDQPLRLKLRQQAAVCTYKDMDLPADTRLDRALDILTTCESLSNSTNQETLGIAGGIYKRKFEIDGQRQQLERSLFYYLRGYVQGAPADKRATLFDYLRDDPAATVTTKDDRGYTGINAAFVLDQLAHLEEKEASAAGYAVEAATSKRAKARLIREEIIRSLRALEIAGETLNWWDYATLGEAYFGIENYKEAENWLVTKTVGMDITPWEYESTSRQLATLAHLQDKPGKSQSDAFETLRKFLKNDAQALESTIRGKIGVGLSGGGFRASLYHIGVLARLAEMDVLRSVEVLSCVSGGSIIGAHYYLELRKLLQEKRDALSEEEYRSELPASKRDWITYQDYIDIVRRIAEDFVKGVQSNIRTRVAAEFFTNLRMIFGKNYSRTIRAGELYEREIFSRVTDGEGHKPRFLSDLFITPREYKEAKLRFSPKNDNWRRRSKVPMLILNAATLNTGHTWHFTASYMGEPPAGIDSQIDGNDYYRRMYYNEAPDGYNQVRLGHAVAASACVPGLFEPLSLDGLYPDRTVRLIDGGTCDNQGVGGMLEQDCNVVLVSDGSGQMESQNRPSKGLLGVPLRSVDIVQARVRAAQFHELSARRRSGLLRGLMFIHLKEDLDVDPVDWIDCQDPFNASDDARPVFRRGPLTKYGIAKSVQLQLATVRTDLDSFSDVEAQTLMTSGYRMTEQAFHQKCVQGFNEPESTTGWKFLAVEEGMRVPGSEHKRIQKLLSVSGSRAFKVWMLSGWLKALALALGLSAAALVIYLFIAYRDNLVFQAITLGSVGFAILSFLLTQVGTMLLGKNAMLIVKLRSTLIRIALGVGVAWLGCIAARIHLHLFDPLFLYMGRVKPLKEQQQRVEIGSSTPDAGGGGSVVSNVVPEIRHDAHGATDAGPSALARATEVPPFGARPAETVRLAQESAVGNGRHAPEPTHGDGSA